MGAEVFHGRVRDGIGCIILAMTTGPPSRILTTDEGCWIWMCVCVCVGVQMVRGLVLRAAGGMLLPTDPGRCGVGLFRSSIGRLGPLG